MAKTSKNKTYPTELTDAQWQRIEPLFANTRTYKWSKRELTNAVLYLVDSGCKWALCKKHIFFWIELFGRFFCPVRFSAFAG